MDTSMLPSAAFGAELSVGWSPAPFDVELRGLFLGPRAATLPANPSQGADLWLTHLGTRACYAAGGTLFRVGPCAGAGFEWTVARGFGPPSDHPADATGEMVVAELGVRATLRLSSRLAARLLAEAVLPFAHPTFVIDGGGDVFHTPVASFRTALGVEAHF